MTLEAPAVGTTVGPWLILERWGSGSFGIIYVLHLAASWAAAAMVGGS